MSGVSWRVAAGALAPKFRISPISDGTRTDAGSTQIAVQSLTGCASVPAMRALAAPFFAAAALLVVAGIGKMRDPQPLVRAARSVRISIPPSAVRGAALLEATLGVVAIWS